MQVREQKSWIRRITSEAAPCDGLLRAVGAARYIASLAHFADAVTVGDLRGVLEKNDSSKKAGLCDARMVERIKDCLRFKPSAVRGLCMVGYRPGDDAGARACARRLFRSVFHEAVDGYAPALEAVESAAVEHAGLVSEWQLLDVLRLASRHDTAGYPLIGSSARAAGYMVRSLMLHSKAAAQSMCVAEYPHDQAAAGAADASSSSSGGAALRLIERVQHKTKLAGMHTNGEDASAPEGAGSKPASLSANSVVHGDVLHAGSVGVAFRRAGLSRAVKKLHSQRLHSMWQLLEQLDYSRSPRKHEVGDFELDPSEYFELQALLTMGAHVAYLSTAAIEEVVLADACRQTFARAS